MHIGITIRKEGVQKLLVFAFPMARAVKWKNRSIRQIRVPAVFVEVAEEVAKLLDGDNAIESLTIKISDRVYNNQVDCQITDLKFEIELKRELVSLLTTDGDDDDEDDSTIWVNPEQMLVNAMLSPWLRKQEIINRLNRAIPVEGLDAFELDDDFDTPFPSEPVAGVDPDSIEDEDASATEAPFAIAATDPVAVEPLEAINEQFEADAVFYRPLPITPPVVEPQTVTPEPFVVIYQGTELQPTTYYCPTPTPVVEAIAPITEVSSTTPSVVETVAPVVVAEVGDEIEEAIPTNHGIAVESPISIEVEDVIASPLEDKLAMSHESVDPIADEPVAPIAIAHQGPVVIEIEEPGESIQPEPLEVAVEPIVVATQEEMVVTEPEMQIGQDLIQQAQQLQEAEKLHQFAGQLYQTWKEIAEQQSSLPWNVPVALETIYRQSFSAMMGHEFVYQVGHVIKDGKQADIVPVLIPGVNNLDINQQEAEFITYRDTSIVTPAPSILSSLAVEIALEAAQEGQAMPVEVVQHIPDEHDLNRLRAERQQHLANVRSNSHNNPGKAKNSTLPSAKTGWKRLLPW